MPSPRTALATLTPSPGGEPSRPADFYAADGQREQIEQLLDERLNGDRWPGVVLAERRRDRPVTVSTIPR